MNSNNFIFDCYSPQRERFPIQGSKYLRTFLSEQPREGIDWTVVARPLPSDKCRFMCLQPSYDGDLFFVFFSAVLPMNNEPGHIAFLTPEEIGQEMGGN